MKTLGKLSASAFPQPAGTVQNPPFDGNVAIDIAIPKPTFDVRDAVRDIYTTSCDKLHLGGLHSVLRNRTKTLSEAFIRASFGQLTTLLNTHLIRLPDHRILMAWLDWESDGNVYCQWLDPHPLQQ
jgi:hypothetical protein